jgi:hypothetical protein
MRTAQLLLLSAWAFCPSLYAVTNCSLFASATPLVREGGIAEAVGDLILSCTDPPTSTGTVNITVSLPTTVTSRTFTGTTPASSEALLLINEPGSGLTGTASEQTACPAADVLAQTCSPDANVFPGFIEPGSNEVQFLNVPFPSTGLPFPGTPVVLRITNIRANMAAFNGQPVGPVVAALSISGSFPLSVEAPSTATVAFYQPAMETPQVLLPDLSGPIPSGGLALSQCVAVNKPLALDPASASAPDGVSFVLRIPEGFPTALKPLSVTSPPPADVNTRPVASTQDMPGIIYNSETAFFNPTFPGNLAIAGLATQATRILVRFNGPAAGVQVHAPVYESGKGPLDSRVRLVAGGPDGSWPTYSPLGPLSSLNTYYSSSQVYVYEVTAKAPPTPYVTDTIDLPFYLAASGAPYVGTGSTSVSVTLAPTSTDFSSSAAYIPRFVDSSTPIPVANLTACAGAPAVKAQISSKSGPAGARVWQIGVNNYGTAAAANAKVTGVALTQTFGAACTPVVSTSFPVSAGTVAASTTVNAPVTLNFTGCSPTVRFKVDIGYAADGGVSGTSTYFNQFQ